MSDYMPKNEEEIRMLVAKAFSRREDGHSKSWGERTMDEQHAFRIIGDECGPYIVRMLLDILDQERAKRTHTPSKGV
jgi:hypothetical protein